MASRCALLLVVALAVGAQAAQRGRSAGSVIQKVIDMLAENKNKVAKDLAAEEKEVAEYATFCDDEATAKGYSIKESVRKMGDLGASIDDAVAQIKAAEETIATLGTEIAGHDKDIAAAEASRKADKKDFEANEQTLLASVEQLEKAIVMVKRDSKEEATPEPATEFLQGGRRVASRKASPKAFAESLAKTLGSVIDAAWIPQGSSKVLKGFIQSEEAAEDNSDLTFKQAPAAEEKSGGVLQTLEDMKTKAEETLSAARQEEMNAGFNSKMMMQSLTTAKEAAEKKLSATKGLAASLGETMGSAKEELSEVKKTKVADESYVKTLTKECKEAAKAWTARQAEAKAEMAAIEKAKEILSEKVKVLVQHDDDYYNSDVSDAAEQAPLRKRLVSHLTELGHKFGSYALAELAGEAAADPFEKVRGVVQDMITKLVTEANEAATQHAFCEEETAKTKKEQEEKTMVSDKLSNRMESAASKQASLKDLIGDLQKQLAESDASASEATKLRAEEKASNTAASKDFKDSAAAVTEAIGALKEYYGGGKGSGAGATIIGILETSEEEFTKMYMETEADEAESEANYKKMMDAAALTKASKTAEMTGAESEIKQLQVMWEEAKEDSKMANKELDAVMEYLEKLKPQCETKAITYEEKKAKREQEIEGLKEALAIIDAPALVQTHRH